MSLFLKPGCSWPAPWIRPLFAGSGGMIPLAFHGGTALRFLFNVARYSEDLAFTLEQAVPRYDFRSFLQCD